MAPHKLKQDRSRLRGGDYPTTGDQLDALWKWYAALPAAVHSPEADAMLARVQATKTRFPKH